MTGAVKSFYSQIKLFNLKITFALLQSHAPSFLLKCLISVTTVILLGLIIAYHAREIQVSATLSLIAFSSLLECFWYKTQI